MNKYKIGDRIILTNQVNHCSDIKNGMIGTIIDIPKFDDYYYGITLDYKKDSYIACDKKF